MLFSKRNRTAVRTAYRALTTYGSFKHAQGRLSAKRSPKTRQALIVAAGGGLVGGLVAGAAFGARAGGCGHDHEHGHADLSEATVDAQAAHATNGALSDPAKI